MHSKWEHYNSFLELLQPNTAQPKSLNESNLLRRNKDEAKNTVLLKDMMKKLPTDLIKFW